MTLPEWLPVVSEFVRGGRGQQALANLISTNFGGIGLGGPRALPVTTRSV